MGNGTLVAKKTSVCCSTFFQCTPEWERFSGPLTLVRTPARQEECGAAILISCIASHD
jgi:hypothetical protein